MGAQNNKDFRDLSTGNLDEVTTDIYGSVEQLSLPEKAALAQHLLSTNELKVVVTSRATVNDAIQQMDHTELGNTLESIAEQVLRLSE